MRLLRHGVGERLTVWLLEAALSFEGAAFAWGWVMEINEIREWASCYGLYGLERAELVAMAIGDSRAASDLLDMVRDDVSRIGQLSVEELMNVDGIGRAKAMSLLACVEIGRRVVFGAGEVRATVTCANDIVHVAGNDMAMLEREELRVILLNNKHEVLGVEVIYRGTVNSASIRVAEVLEPAIRRQCPAIAIAHNHPSGDFTPSPEDVLVTRRLNQSASLMDIELLDHVVVGKKGSISMRSAQLGF